MLCPAASYGVLGMSNGGYAIADLASNGEVATRLPHVAWVITVGASVLQGPWPGPSLAKEPPLAMLAGTEDSIGFDPSDNYAHQLERRDARIVTMHYPGTHMLKGAPLDAALSAVAPLH
jgi:hypothetical protein